MPSGEVTFALDIGTTKIAAAVGRRTLAGLSLLGFGVSPCSTIKRGVVTDLAGTADAIRTAAERAQRMAGVELNRAWVGVTGPHITSLPARGRLAISRNDRQVTAGDLREVMEAASRSGLLGSDRQLLHRVVRVFSVDGQNGVRNPLGMSAARLEADLLLIAGARNFLDNIEKSVARAGFAVREMVFNPIASADAVLQAAEQELGVALADVGGTTTDFAVYARGLLCGVGSLPVGGGHVTQDISIGLSLPREEAERLKLDYGSAIAELVSEEERIKIESGEGARLVSRQLVAGIGEARMRELFSLLGKAISEVPEKPALPCGLVLTGGGALLPGALELAGEVLGAKARLARPRRMVVEGRTEALEGATYSATAGLLHYAEKERRASRLSSRPRRRVGEAWRALWSWMKGRLTE